MPNAGAWRIVEDDLSGADIRALLEQHFAGMLANSPAGSCHFLDFDGLRADGVTFWSIHRGDELAGCGALKMLDHIIDVARTRGLERLSLETGSSGAFEPAIALYQRYGFTECEPFADYKPDPFSRFMTRVL